MQVLVGSPVIRSRYHYGNIIFLFIPHAGIVFYYALLQIAVWWLLHVAAIFWGIKFPFRAKSLAASNRQKYLHIFMVLLGLILPIIPVITTLARGGFVFTPILCIGRKDNATFYSLILPMIILMQIGISMLIIIFWTVHKVCSTT